MKSSEELPPDGGWGFVVVIGLVVAQMVTVIPIAGFGIIYGQFLENTGDVTSGIALTSSIFFAAGCFAGLLTNQLLQMLSYRKVGLLGALLFLSGSFATIFTTSLRHLIITYGVLQGLGLGCLISATYTAFNCYFLKRRNVAMGVAMSVLGFVAIFTPILMQKLMDIYGFRGTVAIMAAISLNAVPAVATLQPVKWHSKLRRLSYNSAEADKQKDKLEHKLLITENHETITNCCKSLNNNKDDGIAVKSCTISSGWNALVKAMDLGLFKDPIYLNITFGISISFASDLGFLPILPQLLNENMINSVPVTVIMTTYLVADLLGRICLSILSAVIDIKARYLFLSGVIASIIFRIAFTVYESFWWTTSVVSVLGFLRSLIQVPALLVLQESYGDRFVTALSLYMVACGCIILGGGFITAIVKDYTNNNTAVVHLLTVFYLLCAITWSIELIYSKFVGKQNGPDKQ